MNRLVVAGSALFVLGVLGYAAGVIVDFPGRSLSVAAIMVGITLIAIRSADGEDDSGTDVDSRTGRPADVIE